MEILLSVIAALGLLALIVYGLHKFQTMEFQGNSDRNVPLPPIELDNSRELSDDDELEASEVLNSPTEETNPERNAALNTALRESSGRSGSQNWQQQVKSLKAEGNLDAAIDRCRTAYPLAGAYQQASLIHRARIRDLQQANAGSEVDHDPRIEVELTALYKTAAISSLLHDHEEGIPDATASQLKQIPAEKLEALDFSYQDIGYLMLKLIKKSDIKLLNQYWGKPDSHKTTKAHLRAEWLKLLGELDF